MPCQYMGEIIHFKKVKPRLKPKSMITWSNTKRVVLLPPHQRGWFVVWCVSYLSKCLSGDSLVTNMIDLLILWS